MASVGGVGSSRPAAASSLAALEKLPKAELHLHLRGAIPRAYLARQLRRYPVAEALAASPPSQLEWMLRQPNVRRIVEADDPPRAIEGLFRYATFEHFLAAYLFTASFVRCIEDFAGLVEGVREGLGRQNIVYAEITVSLSEYVQQGIALDELLAVLGAGRPGSPQVRWIIDPVRNLGPVAAEKLVTSVLAARPETVVGLTLGGAEHLYPAGPFQRVYEIAREGGLRTTVHAGEALGPESVWDALRILDVERVGHGVRAAEDADLVRCLAERRIPLEVCPTSNVRTGVYASLLEHPVGDLYEAGVPVTINTDDPTFFGVTLAEELAGLRELEFSSDKVAELADNAFRFAFDRKAAARIRCNATQRTEAPADCSSVSRCP